MLEVAVQVGRLRSAMKASVDGNRRLLDESRYRIAASRRRLNPVFACAGGSAESDPRPSASSMAPKTAASCLRMPPAT